MLNMNQLPHFAKDRVIDYLMHDCGSFQDTALLPSLPKEWNRRAAEKQLATQFIYPSRKTGLQYSQKHRLPARRLFIMGISKNEHANKSTNSNIIQREVLSCLKLGWPNVAQLDLSLVDDLNPSLLAISISQYLPKIKSLSVKLRLPDIPVLLKMINSLGLPITSLSINIKPIKNKKNLDKVNQVFDKIADRLTQMPNHFNTLKFVGMALPPRLVKKICQTQSQLQNFHLSLQPSSTSSNGMDIPLVHLKTLRIANISVTNRDSQILPLDGRNFPSLQRLHIKRVTIEPSASGCCPGKLIKNMFINEMNIGKTQWPQLIELKLPNMIDDLAKFVSQSCKSLMSLEVKAPIDNENFWNINGLRNRLTNVGVLHLVLNLENLKRLVLKNSINECVHLVNKSVLGIGIGGNEGSLTSTTTMQTNSLHNWKCKWLEEFTVDTWELNLKEIGIICKYFKRLNFISVNINGNDIENEMQTIDSTFEFTHQHIYKMDIIYQFTQDATKTTIDYTIIDNLISRFAAVKHVNISIGRATPIPTELCKRHPNINFQIM